MEGQSTELRARSAEGKQLAAVFEPAARLLELEAENARLKSLVGELLVANQLLRECREQYAEMKAEIKA